MTIGDISFLNPERLWWLLVVPVLVIAYIWATRRKSRVAMRYTNTSVLAQVMPKQSQWRRHLAVAASLLALLAMAVAWARPFGVEKVERERATIVMVLDISLSMTATDVKPNRLDAEKAAAIAFMKTLPAGFNVSVVSLSGNPAVRLPPTTDRGMAERAITALQPQESTAIGEAIYTALDSLKSAPKGTDGSAPPGAIVLLSDGTNTAGRPPAQAAQAASADKIPVYTIAYGTENGYVDVDGKREKVPPDTPLLQSIAKATGAQSWTADSANQLDTVYKNVKSQVGYEEAKKETTSLWAGYALAFAVVAALAAVSLGARWP